MTMIAIMMTMIGLMTMNDIDSSNEHVDDDEGDDITMVEMMTTTMLTIILTVMSKNRFSKHNVSFVHTSVIYIVLV